MVHAVNSQGFRLLLRYLTDRASSASAQEDLPDRRSDRSVRPPRPGSGLHFRSGVIRTGPLSNLRTWARAAACPRPRRGIRRLGGARPWCLWSGLPGLL